MGVHHHRTEPDAIDHYEMLIKKAKELLKDSSATYEDAFNLFERVSDAMGTVIYIYEDAVCAEAKACAGDVLTRTDRVVGDLEDRMIEFRKTGDVGF